MKSKTKKGIDKIENDFHDDKLLGFEIDIAKMKALLVIQTFKWIEADPTDNPEEYTTGKTYRGIEDKVVEIHLKLKEGQPFFEGELNTIISDSILWVEHSDTDLYVVLCNSDLHFKIEGIEIREG